MHPDAKRILLTEEQIKQRVEELGRQISLNYKGKNLLVVGILKGAIIFMSDLVRQLEGSVGYDFMAVSSYGTSTESSGVVRILKDLDQSIEGRHVLIVEDIIDSGLTLNYLMDNLRSRNPKSLEICALLDKPERRKVKVEAKYIGFSIEDEFVVGYGLDFSERYRNNPYIFVLDPSVYEGWHS